MNKNDCEHIAYLLVQYLPPGHGLCEAIFAMDSRIESEFNGFREIQGESDEIYAMAEELMERYNGNQWYIMKAAVLTKSYAECLDEARRTVLGDEYDPRFFRR